MGIDFEGEKTNTRLNKHKRAFGWKRSLTAY